MAVQCLRSPMGQEPEDRESRQRDMRPRLIIGLIIVVAGCGSGETAVPDSSTSTSGATSTTVGSSTTREDRSTTSTSVIAEDKELEMGLAEGATSDLARRLGVDEDDVEVLRVEAVTWPDGSLGCPQPGMVYTQALVEGHRIVLSHAERVYLYHSGPGQPPFLCESDEKDGGYDFIPPPGFDES